MNNIENPLHIKCSGFSIGKKRGRKEEKRQRLTASVAFLEYRIIPDYDRGIKELRTILGETMNYLAYVFWRYTVMKPRIT